MRMTQSFYYGSGGSNMKHLIFHTTTHIKEIDNVIAIILGWDKKKIVRPTTNTNANRADNHCVINIFIFFHQ